MVQIRWAREPWPPGGCIQVFPKDKEFRAFEMLEKIEVSLKPRRCVLHARLVLYVEPVNERKLACVWCMEKPS
jgi:hypothetical protein